MCLHGRGRGIGGKRNRWKRKWGRGAWPLPLTAGSLVGGAGDVEVLVALAVVAGAAELSRRVAGGVGRVIPAADEEARGLVGGGAGDGLLDLVHGVRVVAGAALNISGVVARQAGAERSRVAVHGVEVGNVGVRNVPGDLAVADRTGPVVAARRVGNVNRVIVRQALRVVANVGRGLRGAVNRLKAGSAHAHDGGRAVMARQAGCGVEERIVSGQCRGDGDGV